MCTRFAAAPGSSRSAAGHSTTCSSKQDDSAGYFGAFSGERVVAGHPGWGWLRAPGCGGEPGVCAPGLAILLAVDSCCPPKSRDPSGACCQFQGHRLSTAAGLLCHSQGSLRTGSVPTTWPPTATSGHGGSGQKTDHPSCSARAGPSDSSAATGKNGKLSSALRCGRWVHPRKPLRRSRCLQQSCLDIRPQKSNSGQNLFDSHPFFYGARGVAEDACLTCHCMAASPGRFRLFFFSPDCILPLRGCRRRPLLACSKGQPRCTKLSVFPVTATMGQIGQAPLQKHVGLGLAARRSPFPVGRDALMAWFAAMYACFLGNAVQLANVRRTDGHRVFLLPV